jgi:hypothetical protein
MAFVPTGRPVAAASSPLISSSCSLNLWIFGERTSVAVVPPVTGFLICVDSSEALKQQLREQLSSVVC